MSNNCVIYVSDDKPLAVEEVVKVKDKNVLLDKVKVDFENGFRVIVKKFNDEWVILKNYKKFKDYLDKNENLIKGVISVK